MTKIHLKAFKELNIGPPERVVLCLSIFPMWDDNGTKFGVIYFRNRLVAYMYNEIMVREEDSVFEGYAASMRSGVIMLDARAKQIHEHAQHPDQRDDPVAILFNQFRVKSLEVYSQYLSFIADEFLRLEDDKSFFRLSTLRALMDIYARNLYVHDTSIMSEDRRALIILTYQLRTFHLVPDIRGFEVLLALNESLLVREMPDYPRKHSEFDFYWLRDRKLLIPPWREVLTEEKMTSFSKRAATVFGAKKQYEIYSYVSEIVHGNPYLKHGMGRERFWLASLGLGTTAYFLDFVDAHILKEEHRKDFRDWLKDIKAKKNALLPLWLEARAQQA
ncbi:MAG: hypothetical protein WC050_00115 [Candidatus Paceibacterota bacterium]